MRELEPQDSTPSIAAKIGASVGGFLCFYALGMLLALLLNAVEAMIGAEAAVAGALVALAALVAVAVWMVRALRGKGSFGHGALRWFVLGFVAAMTVFGGCLMLISGL